MSFLIFDEDYPFFYFIIDMLRALGMGFGAEGLGHYRILEFFVCCFLSPPSSSNIPGFGTQLDVYEERQKNWFVH